MHQEQSQAWRALMVPDWRLGGLGHLWYQILHHESILYAITELYADFQLPNMIRSSSSIWLYLEDI